MAKKLGELIKDLLKKAGVDITADDLKTAIASDLEIPDDAANKLETGLMSLDAAKNNPTLIKQIKAEVLNGADQKMAAIMAELELEEDDDFKGEKNSFEKIAKLAKLAKAAGEKKSGATGAKDKTEWAEKEKEYNRQLKEVKDNLTAKEKEFATTRENDLTSFELQKILGGKNYIFPAEMDASLKVSTALSAVNAALGKSEMSIKRNQAGQLVILNKDGNPAYSDKNVALEPNSFIDGVLAQNKLLKTVEETPPGPGGPHLPGGGGGNNGNAAIAAELSTQLAEVAKM